MPPAGVNLHLGGEGLDSIDIRRRAYRRFGGLGSGHNTGQHLRITYARICSLLTVETIISAARFQGHCFMSSAAA